MTGSKKGVKSQAAGGAKIKNEGQTKIVHITENNDHIDFTFQHADVAMPVLSIRKVAHRGCTASFWKGGGEIVFASGIRMPIIERLGFYFVCLKVKRPENASGGARPEP